MSKGEEWRAADHRRDAEDQSAAVQRSDDTKSFVEFIDTQRHARVLPLTDVRYRCESERAHARETVPRHSELENHLQERKLVEDCARSRSLSFAGISIVNRCRFINLVRLKVCGNEATEIVRADSVARDGRCAHLTRVVSEIEFASLAQSEGTRSDCGWRTSEPSLCHC